MPFQSFSLDSRLLRATEHLGFEKPTEIQQRAIPEAMTGKDLIASSKTGSGKTLAYLLPAMNRLLKNRALSKRDARALILAPTRELAKQVYNQFRSLANATSLDGALILGGENFNDQIKILRKDPAVIIATPGRLVDHLKQRSVALDGLELLILDEADRMLDLGFAEELKLINQAASHRLRQTLMFSATLDDVQIHDLAAALLKSPKRIAVGESHQQHDDILQRFYLCDHLDHKHALLMHFLHNETIKQGIIFTATRADTSRIASLIQETFPSAVALSGDLSQSARNRIMEEFSRGLHQFLVTTDVASRGLDLLNVSHVFNFDMPKHAEEYVHRIGRTGRAGFKGDAISLIGPKDWINFKQVESFLQQPLRIDKVEGLEGNFKGLAPQKTKKVNSNNTGKKSVAAQPQQKKKGKPKKEVKFVDFDAGAAPVLKRRGPRKPDLDE